MRFVEKRSLTRNTKFSSTSKTPSLIRSLRPCAEWIKYKQRISLEYGDNSVSLIYEKGSTTNGINTEKVINQPVAEARAVMLVFGARNKDFSCAISCSACKQLFRGTWDFLLSE